MFSAKKALHVYKGVDVDAKAEFANPYELTQMLFDGALKSLALVSVLIERKEWPECSKEVSRSVGIINGLKNSLDLSRGELAENLFQLYSYMMTELMRAYKEKDVDAIRAVRRLLSEINDAWSQIPVEYRG